MRGKLLEAITQTFDLDYEVVLHLLCVLLTTLLYTKRMEFLVPFYLTILLPFLFFSLLTALLIPFIIIYFFANFVYFLYRYKIFKIRKFEFKLDFFLIFICYITSPITLYLARIFIFYN
jgi:hypothetical protein